mmetsp:Transcript_19639/g.48875  ORF Transcript_19639/g.48875 Transcript_19639/m.48875 type:complete len:117 (+) Transcript_19639:205-555(+)
MGMSRRTQHTCRTATVTHQLPSFQPRGVENSPPMGSGNSRAKKLERSNFAPENYGDREQEHRQESTPRRTTIVELYIRPEITHQLVARLIGKATTAGTLARNAPDAATIHAKQPSL